MTAVLQLAQPTAALPTGPVGLVAASTAATKIVLAVLVVLSLVSWAIMFLKWREFGAARRETARFTDEFTRAHDVGEVAGLARRLPESAPIRVVGRAMQFLEETRPALGATADRGARLSGSQVEALRLVLDAEANAARDTLARFVPWLATIGSVSPLIGLFGTVLGVIDAFLGIAARGSGNIGAVAPGVAEALIATAAALAVAIPAVFGYNLFASRLNRLDGELEGFGSELIALMVREGRI